MTTDKERLDRQTDWYQQRFNRLRQWVEEEVKPLSQEVAHRYYAIVANGSPAPHESADWRETMHGLTLRAEQAERERDEALVPRIANQAVYRAELSGAQKALDAVVKMLESCNDRIVPIGCDETAWERFCLHRYGAADDVRAMKPEEVLREK